MNSNEMSIGLMVLLAVSLGIRHGFDLDHLATIDAIARSMKERPTVSRLTGFLFSLGHGIIVILFCLLLGSGFVQSYTPAWLEILGKGISIFFLIVFGIINLIGVLTRKHSSDVPKGIKSFLSQKIFSKQNSPWMIILIGGLFALSFDTFSQAALFSLSAGLIAKQALCFILGIAFMFGMMISDGINGIIVAKLIRIADTKSRYISKGLGILISCFSLFLGIYGLLN
ncbi:MAG: DNA repair protein [Chlamydiae bacterium]|nr:DNA repair protein [Chlamydiota bacterium]